MKAKSIKGRSAEEIQLALEQSMADGFRPTLAFVFISIKQNRDAVSAMLDAKGIRLFGATTGGEFIDGDAGTGSIAILLLDMNKSNFRILLEDYSEKDPATVAGTMAEKAMKEFKNPAFILSCGIELATGLAIGEPIIRAIEAVAGKDTTIWGGMAGDDFQFKETFVFTNQQSLSKGILLLVVDGDKVLLGGQAASGQKPAGTEKTVTRMIGNWIHSIDNQPAAEMVLKYMGLNLTREQAETFTPGTIVFSLSREMGEPVMRSSGVFNWENKSIAINGSVKEGDKIRLTLPPDFEIVEEVSKDAEKMKQTKMPEADALLMFSCIGRLGAFGPLINDEIEGVKNAFNVPLAGFFTYGEFGRATHGNNEYHNMTCCWVALKEK